MKNLLIQSNIDNLHGIVSHRGLILGLLLPLPPTVKLEISFRQLEDRRKNRRIVEESRHWNPIWDEIHWRNEVDERTRQGRNHSAGDLVIRPIEPVSDQRERSLDVLPILRKETRLLREPLRRRLLPKHVLHVIAGHLLGPFVDFLFRIDVHRLFLSDFAFQPKAGDLFLGQFVVESLPVPCYGTPFDPMTSVELSGKNAL